MNASRIKPEDIVQCNVRGDKFYAIVQRAIEMDTTLKKRVVLVNSLTSRPIPTRRVTAREIIGHWRHSRQSKTNGD